MPTEVEIDGKKVKVWTEDEVDQEVKGLKVTVDNLKSEKGDLSEKLKESKELARVAEEAKAKAEGDNETLKRIAEEREADKRQAVEEERKKFSDLLNQTKKEKVDNFLNGLLDEVNTADPVRRKQLRKLLKVDFDIDYDTESGDYKVLGEGVASVDDLKRAITEGNDYKFYLAGSGATGTGATGSKGAGVAGKKFDQYSGSELAALRQESPAEYDRIKSEFYGT